MTDLTKKLLPYQVPHLLQLYECLKIKKRVIRNYSYSFKPNI